MKKMFHAVAAALIAAALFAAPASAWDDGDVLEFQGGGEVREMAKPETPEEVTVISQNTPAPGFVPINEITYIERVSDAPPAVAPAEETAKNERLSNALGGRFAFGNPIVNIGGSVKIGLTASDRIDVGINASLFGVGGAGYTAWGFESLWFYERRFNISDDGILNWFVGPGVAFGYYITSARIPADPYEGSSAFTDTYKGFNIGVGAQLGLEVDFRFIDPDHSLYETFKNTAMTLDIRPMLHPQRRTIEHYPWLVFTVGIGFRYLL
ncbi:MAG: hypothetical protein LBC70_05235 [Chitinispirillales bacterium]|jgi:hypothetical protein|nr:hypothetical protein [Chitinispirillales bacterium]